MPTLSQAERDELAELIPEDVENFTAEDAVAYYSYLAGKGFDYGTLALGVVQDNTARGRVANNYAELAAECQGKDFSVGSPDWKAMQWNLMQNDLAFRNQNAGSDLTRGQYTTAHAEALQDVGLPPETWTAYDPLEIIAKQSPAAADAAWEDLASDTGYFDGWFTEGLFTIGIGQNISAQQSPAEILADYDKQAQWYARIAAAVVQAGAGAVDDLFADSVYPDYAQDFQTFEDFLGDIISPGGSIKPPCPDEPPPAQPERPLADFVDDALLGWGMAPNAGSPLILDLDGDGVEATAFGSTTATFFDVDADGFAEQTAWIGSDDGFLAYDIDSSGTIDSVDGLFGSTTVDGFALLATYDSNGDHRIDQYDEIWNDLLVWKDANGDAATQSAELYSLSSLDIASIDLAGVAPSSTTINGNSVSHTSTFRFENGTVQSVADVWFNYSNVNSIYVGDFTLDIRSVYLPNLRGYGVLADLQLAMSLDTDLLNLLKNFSEDWDASRFADGASLDNDVAEILWTWAGVEGVNPTSRGDYIDARTLGFMEAFFGNEFLQGGQTSSPGEGASSLLMETWDILFRNLKAQLIFQSGGNGVFDAASSYNVFSGNLEGALSVTSDGADLLEAGAPTTGIESYWASVAEYLHTVRGLTTLTVSEEGFLDDAVVATDPSLSWEGIKNAYLTETPGDTVYGTSAAETLDGTQYADLIYGQGANDIINAYEAGDTVYGGHGDDTIYGGQGNDTLYGDTDNDIIHGDAGNDVLHGGSGNDTLHAGDGGDIVYGGDGTDTYVYSGGNDYYVEQTTSQTDTIVLPVGVDLGDLTFSRGDVDAYGRAELLILVDGWFGSIEIKGFFYGGTILSNSIEQLLFDDSSTFNLNSFTSLTTFGSDTADYIVGIENGGGWADTIYGFGGADRLFGGGGNDILDGGIGNDELNGQAGNDIYMFSPGFDQINESSGGTDIIRLPAGYTAQDLSYVRHSSSPDDLIVTVDGLGQIKIGWQFYGFSSTIVEYVDFNGSNAIDLTQVSIETFGTNGNDNITGVSSGASQNDIIDGGYGNDNLQGQAGNDIYFFSAGNDTISETNGSDTLAFREGVVPGQVTIYRDGSANQSKNLIVEDGNGNTTTIKNHFYSSSSSIETITFADSTIWSLSVLEVETRGTSANDTIYAHSYGDASADDIVYGYGGADQIDGGVGDDRLYGGTGNDTLSGQNDDDQLYGEDGDDYLSGGAGNDLFVFTSGLDTVTEHSGMDVLLISSGYTINDLGISDYSTYDVKVVMDAGVDEVTLALFRQNANTKVEIIRFDDGFETDLTSYATWLNGTSGSDMVAGNANDNTLIGFAGNDTITGGDGADDANGGAGNDSLEGEDGDDLLYGGDGDDMLYGGAGLDTMHGGDGADTFVLETASAFSNVDVIRDFNVSDDDVLDLTDILDTVYDPMTDAISDFIQFTESNGSTFVEVDRDGTGSTYSFAQIVKLENVVGLSSPELLETNGNLLAA